MRIRRLFWGIGLLAAVSSAGADDRGGEARDLVSRYTKYHTSYRIAEDGTAIETREWAVKVLKESALAWSKRAHVSHSTSVQKAEILAAYTQKADGRRIDAPKDNYQIEVNAGRERGAPAFSDRTTVSVVFPDVAVGDTVVLSYRLTQTEPLFPKHFSVAETFPRQAAFDDVRVRIDYPAALWVQYDGRGMETAETPERDGRKAVEWTYRNPTPQRSRRRDWSVMDPEKEIGYAFSTFRDYASIASAYGVRALPKAAVTQRVAALAGDIVKDRQTPREQARALYDWVATNITYAGNCIGIGAVVPRDLSFILDNRMGDCKDQATLLQALLAARGIRSTQALVNSGSVYALPRIPVVSMVNHVINYLPDLDLYADATARTVPFGMLPYADAGKPVLLVEGHRDGTKTPATAMGASQQKMHSRLKLHADGAMSGTIEVFEKGPNAAETRAMAREMTRDVEEEFVKNAFRAMGKVGFGKLEKDDPAELSDSYHYKVTFSSERFATLSGAGAFAIQPVLGSSAPIERFVASVREPEEEVDVACSSGTSTEEYSIELPKRMKVLSIPPGMKVGTEFYSYQSAYKLKGNVLTARRTLEDRTPGNVCPPAMIAEYRKFGEKVIEDLKAQVLYK